MSRVGRQPVAIPADVKVSVTGSKVAVEGPKGKLEREFRPEVEVALDSNKNEIRVTAKGEGRIARSLHGLTRALVSNMVQGVKDGFKKKVGGCRRWLLSGGSGNRATDAGWICE